MSRWYDVCCIYYKTPQRVALFDFTDPVLHFRPMYGVLYVLKGNPKNVNPNEVSDVTRKIGFLQGDVYDENCLGDSGVINGFDRLSPLHKVHYNTVNDAVEALRSEEIVAFFTFYRKKDLSLSLYSEAIGLQIRCGRGSGGHFIMRKGNPLRHWWNDAFAKIQENGKYYKLCINNERKYGIELECV
ncbi:uncharacterized protein LOC144347583 [Saccoglossus kowalevskii]